MAGKKKETETGKKGPTLNLGAWSQAGLTGVDRGPYPPRLTPPQKMQVLEVERDLRALRARIESWGYPSGHLAVLDHYLSCGNYALKAFREHEGME
jgi:hypothetical protein